jgi:hypothetical protein
MRLLRTSEWKEINKQAELFNMFPEFSEPKNLWMKRTLKTHRKTGELGYSKVNWDRLGETVR